MTARRQQRSARLAAMLVCGAAAAALTGSLGAWPFAPAIGWTAAALVYVVWVWAVIGGMDPRQTATHATTEDPGRRISDALLLSANVGSVAAVVVMMMGSHQATGTVRAVLAILAILSVATSWVLVQTLFTLRYAELYYTGTAGGVDFNQDADPRYIDFAYLSFTLGMTYQVSDTALRNPDMRGTALRHGLLAYLFGTMILATTISFVAGLVQ